MVETMKTCAARAAVSPRFLLRRASAATPLRRLASLLATAALLGGCGGGGEGGGTGGSSGAGGGGAELPGPTYAIGGTVTDLAAGESVVLHDDGAGEITVSADGSFTFATELAPGTPFEVVVAKHPASQQCSIVAGSGTATADTTTVEVRCFARVVLDANPMSRSVRLSWNDSGATSYALYSSTDPGCDISEIATCAGGTVQEVDAASSPLTVTALQNGTHYSFWLEANHGDGHATVSASGARPSRLVTNGHVNAIATGDDGSVYLGGSFTKLSASSGGGVPLRTDGLGTHPFPVVAGTVSATAPDGAGGWYIGGRFTEVGDEARNNVAHVRADGSVGPWDPDADDAVLALAVRGDSVLRGRQFHDDRRCGP